MIPTIKEIVKDNTVEFLHFTSDELHYTVKIKTGTEVKPSFGYSGEEEYDVFDTYSFSIPTSETKGATFKAKDKAIYFMRFINTALKNGTFRKI